MKHRLTATVIATFVLTTLACSLTPGTQTDDAQVALARTQAALAVTQTAVSQLADVPPTDTLSPTPTVAPPTTPPTGSIGGLLSFPSERIPPLSVYAFSTTSSDYYYVDTVMDQGDFLISGLPPGTYYVVAYTTDGTISGGWTQAVPCGLSAACNDHSLIPVIVVGGQITEGVQVYDWYAPPGTFPSRPAY